MAKKIQTIFTPEKVTYPTEWYDKLKKDCLLIVVDAQKKSRLNLLRARWMIGDRILKDLDKFDKQEYGNVTLSDLALYLELGSKQRVSEIIRFRQIVGEDFESWLKEQSDLSDTISWRTVVHELLPKGKIEKKPSKEEQIREEIEKCNCIPELKDALNRSLDSLVAARNLLDNEKLELLSSRIFKVESVLHRLMETIAQIVSSQ